MAPRKRSDWPRLLADSMTLGLNANLVITLRLAKIAWGGPAAKTESLRMVEEKIQAAREANISAAQAVLTGKAHLAPKRAMSVYQRRVRKNLERLSK
jgi:xanthine dehydrogenase iron-sulfur cluster and FAD-binding subunit A